MIVKIPTTAGAGAARQIHLGIAAVTEDNSRGRDFGGNIQVGTGLIRVLYIFVGDTIVSTPQDARQHQHMRKQTNMKTRRPLKHARRVYKKPAQVTLQGA